MKRIFLSLLFVVTAISAIAAQYKNTYQENIKKTDYFHIYLEKPLNGFPVIQIRPNKKMHYVAVHLAEDRGHYISPDFDFFEFIDHDSDILHEDLYHNNERKCKLYVNVARRNHFSAFEVIDRDTQLILIVYDKEGNAVYESPIKKVEFFDKNLKKLPQPNIPTTYTLIANLI